MNQLDFLDHWSAVLYIIGIVINFAFGWFAWSMRKEFVSQKDHDQLKERVSSLEGKIQTLPSSETMHQLSLQITKLEGTLGAMSVRFENVSALGKRMQDQVDRMEDYLDRRET